VPNFMQNNHFLWSNPPSSIREEPKKCFIYFIIGQGKSGKRFFGMCFSMYI